MICPLRKPYQRAVLSNLFGIKIAVHNVGCHEICKNVFVGKYGFPNGEVIFLTGWCGKTTMVLVMSHCMLDGEHGYVGNGLTVHVLLCPVFSQR